MYAAYVGTIETPVARARTADQAVTNALRELRRQGAIGPGEHQWPTDDRAIAAMQIVGYGKDK